MLSRRKVILVFIGDKNVAENIVSKVFMFQQSSSVKTYQEIFRQIQVGLTQLHV